MTHSKLPQCPTPFAEVNAVVDGFLADLEGLLEAHLIGMYLVGSVALGDFDPKQSDIDLIVVTGGELDDALVVRLAALHARFAASNSFWSTKVEAVYVPQEALRVPTQAISDYPQVEQGTVLFLAVLEAGWVFQRHTLREQGVVVAGPNPQTLTPPVSPEEMSRAVSAIAGQWLFQAKQDPSWLEWLTNRPNQAFVILTLCRMLYSLATGLVASKPFAAEWARKTLDTPWPTLIEQSFSNKDTPGPVEPNLLEQTYALIEYTYLKSQSGIGH